MPHTSRKKQPTHAKRKEILDENGWTRVTTANPHQRAPRRLANEGDLIKSQGLRITEIPDGATLDKLEERYKIIEKRWLESQSWITLKETLNLRVTRSTGKVDRCIVFGTGTPSGYRENWIMRHDVALYQIAAFKAIVDEIASLSGSRPEAYAQEPQYNPLDVEFLTGLNINAVKSPKGFPLITPESLVYLPSAELQVEMQAYSANPAAALTCKLDYYWRNERGQPCTSRQSSGIHTVTEQDDPEGNDSQKLDEKLSAHSIDDSQSTETAVDELEMQCGTLERFKSDRGKTQLRDLDVKDQPFHGMYLYWKIAEEAESNTNP